MANALEVSYAPTTKKLSRPFLLEDHAARSLTCTRHQNMQVLNTTQSYSDSGFLTGSVENKEGNETFSKYLSPIFPSQPAPAKQTDKQLGQSPISLSVCLAEKGTGGTKETNTLKTFHITLPLTRNLKASSTQTCTAQPARSTFPGSGLAMLTSCVLQNGSNISIQRREVAGSTLPPSVFAF